MAGMNCLNTPNTTPQLARLATGFQCSTWPLFHIPPQLVPPRSMHPKGQLTRKSVTCYGDDAGRCFMLACRVEM